MSTFYLIITILIIGAGFATPFLLLRLTSHMNKADRGVAFFFMGLILMISISILFVWWGNKSDELLLKHYGYNFNYMNNEEKYENVSSENLSNVKKLETGIMGVGWPIGAIFPSILSIIYLILIYAVRDNIPFAKKNDVY